MRERKKYHPIALLSGTLIIFTPPCRMRPFQINRRLHYLMLASNLKAWCYPLG